jgi:hypothetical protein
MIMKSCAAIDRGGAQRIDPSSRIGMTARAV